MTNLQELTQQGAISPEAIMHQLAQENPKLATLMQLMASQQNNTDTEEVDWESEPPPQSARDNRLIEEVRTLRRANLLLTRQAEILADALGACHCFGFDESCPDCHGDGAPGTFVPGRLHFEQFVVPVLLNLKQWRAERVAQGKRPNVVENEQTPNRADEK